MNAQPIKRIPYGVADCRRIRTDHAYYVDKGWELVYREKWEKGEVQ